MALAASAADFYRSIGYEPGEAPFRVRGNAYVFHHQYVAECLPGGADAQREALGSLADHPFFGTLFLANAWYDVFPLVALGYACAQVTSTRFEDFIRVRTLDQAIKDLRFIRRLLVKLASPVAVASRLPSIATSYFDFISLDKAEIASHSASSVMRGIPQPLVPWLQLTCSTFSEHVMQVNGAAGVTIKITPSGTPNVRDGMPISALAFSINWKTQ